MQKSFRNYGFEDNYKSLFEHKCFDEVIYMFQNVLFLQTYTYTFYNFSLTWISLALVTYKLSQATQHVSCHVLLSFQISFVFNPCIFGKLGKTKTHKTVNSMNVLGFISTSTYQWLPLILCWCYGVCVCVHAFNAFKSRKCCFWIFFL